MLSLDTILIIFLIISIISNIFLYKSLSKSFKINDILEGWILDFKDEIILLYKKVKHIDDRGIFEKDDDVGILFQEIQRIIFKTKRIIIRCECPK
jgi:hypothetical protein